MTVSLAPTIPDIIEHQLPVSVNTPSNTQFVSLLKHYYDWLVAEGQPTEFIQNILKYRDLDLTNDTFRLFIAASILDEAPSYAKADKTILTKHIAEFLKSKGSLESFQYIMNAIYGEDIQIEWNSNKLFRASANEFSRKATLTIESAAAWSNVTGSEIIQTSPHPASAIISTSITTTGNNVQLNWLELDDKTINGIFVPEGTVEVIHNDVNRSWYRVKEYYQPISLINHVLQFTATTEEQRPYNNLIVKQIGTDFRAVVSGFNSRNIESNYTRISLTLQDETGTFNSANELYIFPSSLEDILYTKEEVEVGIVSNAIVDVFLVSNGSMYSPGDTLSFLNGSGEKVDGYVSEVGSGKVTEVNIIRKGYGYSIGDELRTIDDNVVGASAEVIVSAIDGVDGDISLVSELNGAVIVDSGCGYAVNDEFELIGGTRVPGTPPAKLKAATVASAWLFKGINILTSGNEYPLYTKIALINTATTTKIAGFTATPTIASGKINDITITSIPTISVATLAVVANGYGATATATISANRITDVPVTNVGVNYVDPVARIIGDGTGAIIRPVMTNNTITSFIINDGVVTTTNKVSGGSGYTYANVSIGDGTGFIGQANIVGNAVDSITVIQGGTGYLTSSTITITGDGVGASYNLTGCIGGGGAGYTTATVEIKERNGLGFTATPIFQNQTAVTGSVTSLTILSRGQYTELPNCFEMLPTTKTGTGAGVKISMDFRLLSAAIENNGTHYNAISTAVSGKGTGAQLIPQLRDGVIVATNKVLGGSGYTYAYVLIGGGTGFIGQAVIVGNAVDSISVIQGGYGYQTSSPVTIIGDGINASYNLTGCINDGVLQSISVIDGGRDYYNGTTVTYPQGGPGAATLTPTIVNGEIKSIASSGGYGYVPADMANGTINSGTQATLTTTISGTGAIVGYDAEDEGSGYWTQGEVTPLSITTGVAGSGALFIPTLDSYGRIVAVDVIEGGSGYTNSSTISVAGGAGLGASLSLIVYSGRVEGVNIISGGAGYEYGTYAIILGDGLNAAITPIVETGITSAEVLIGGINYTAATDFVVINDPTGTGAVIVPNIVNGVIMSLTIVNKGSGYTNPQLSITGGTGASLIAVAKRGITSLNVTNKGTGYTYADVIIIGDGTDAKYNLTFDKLGSINTTAVNNAGTGLTSTPIVTITDGSGYGAVSKVKIVNAGEGYMKPPVIVLDDKFDINDNLIASGTKFTSYGDKIGSVKCVMFKNAGAGYDDVPIPIFPLVATLTENAAFKLGEVVSMQSGHYPDTKFGYTLLESGDKILLENGDVLVLDVTFTDYLLLESNNRLLLENGDVLILDIDPSFTSYDETAIVKGFDFDRNSIELFMDTDTFMLSTEDGNDLISEDGIDVIFEQSGSFNVGDIIVGATSGSKATIKNLNRANGWSVQGGNNWLEYKFKDETGMCNSAGSVIANNQRYQDYAYVVKAGIALKDYENLLKESVHPAGFALFGDVVTQTKVDLDILNFIGYNSIVVILFLYSISDEARSGPEWSRLTDLFGDLVKFNFNYMPISLVQDYDIWETSDIVFANYNDYYTTTTNIEGTAQGATSSTLTLNTASASIADDLYNGRVISITGGVCAGQQRTVTANRKNLVKYSEELDNAVWMHQKEGLNVTANVQFLMNGYSPLMSPIGTRNVDSLIETTTNDYHRIGYDITDSAGTARRFSFYAKYETGYARNAYVRGWSWPGGDTSAQYFDMLLGTCSGSQSPTIEAIDGGWWRCSFNIPSSHTSVVVGTADGIVTGNSPYLGQGDGVTGVYMWGMQLEVGTATTSYIQTIANAAVGVTISQPWDVNLFTYSEELERSTSDMYQQEGCSISVNQILAPDGTMSAEKIIEDNVAISNHSLWRTTNIVTESPKDITFSFFAKAAERTKTQILIEYSFGGEYTQILGDFNLSNGTSIGTGTSIENIGGGWYRCSLTVTVPAGMSETWVSFGRILLADGSSSYLGDGTSGLYIWGAQLEYGAITRPYIKTTSFIPYPDATSAYNLIGSEYLSSLVSNDLTEWTIENNIQMTKNTAVAPDGSMTMTRVTDTSDNAISMVDEHVACSIGDVIMLEAYIKKQVGSLTYPSLKISDSAVIFDELRINLETGEYFKIGASTFDVLDLSDYWFIRIKHVATTTLVEVHVHPSVGYVSNLEIENISAMGSIEISNVIVKNITGQTLTPGIVRAVNSKYIPDQFNLCDSESVIVIT